ASVLRLSGEAGQERTLRRLRAAVLALVQADDGGPGAPPASAAAAAAATAPPEGDPPTAPATALPAGASGADVPGWVRSLLRCPDRGGELRVVERALQCTGCGRVHPVEGGIPVLIAGRAEAPAAQ